MPIKDLSCATAQSKNHLDEMKQFAKGTLIEYFGKENQEKYSSSENLRKLKFEALKTFSSSATFFEILIEIGAVHAILEQLINYPGDVAINQEFVIPSLTNLWQKNSISLNIAYNVSKNLFGDSLENILSRALAQINLSNTNNQSLRPFQNHTNSNQEKPASDPTNG